MPTLGPRMTIRSNLAGNSASAAAEKTPAFMVSTGATG